MITPTEFADSLRESAYKIEFTKADGTLRKMTATRISSEIPLEKAPKESREITDTQNAVPVFDLDIGEWRSVTIKNIISMEKV